MRKKFLLFILLFGSYLSVMSQSFLECVYLKNGNIIRGVIVEQIPGEWLKIQTSNGSIYEYWMSDVLKITEEEFVNDDRIESVVVKKASNIATYRSFADLGFTLGTGVFGDEHIEASTSQGYLFNPYVFVGLGISARYYFGYNIFSAPVFVNSRIFFSDRKTTPYLDLRAGYSLFSGAGIYFNPNLGLRINLGKHNRPMNISVGYTLQKSEIFGNLMFHYGYYHNYVGSGKGSNNGNIGGITFKLGTEF